MRQYNPNNIILITVILSFIIYGSYYAINKRNNMNNITKLYPETYSVDYTNENLFIIIISESIITIITICTIIFFIIMLIISCTHDNHLCMLLLIMIIIICSMISIINY